MGVRMGNKVGVKGIIAKEGSKGGSTFSDAMLVHGKEERAGNNVKMAAGGLQPPSFMKNVLGPGFRMVRRGLC